MARYNCPVYRSALRLPRHDLASLMRHGLRKGRVGIQAYGLRCWPGVRTERDRLVPVDFGNAESQPGRRTDSVERTGRYLFVLVSVENERWRTGNQSRAAVQRRVGTVAYCDPSRSGRMKDQALAGIASGHDL